MTPLRSPACIALGTVALLACTKPEEADTRRPPPPPVASATPGSCAAGGGQVKDPVSQAFFPRVSGDYCIDPGGEERTYGEQGKLDMDAVCTTAFDGECAIYNQFGLKRLVSLRYVDGAGGGGTVDVYLSRFADVVGAYGMFTKRVVADGDPAEPTTPKPLAAGAAGALGTGRAYVWKGTYLAELQYNNEQETPEALSRSSAKALTTLAKGIGTLLPGSSDLPAPVALLPAEGRLPSGVQLLPKNGLGIEGLGPLAVGYYGEGSARYRLLSMALADDAQAKGAWKVLHSVPGALPVQGVGDDALAATLPAHHLEYVFARKGNVIVGAVEDEFRSDAKGPIPRAENVARLKAWLSKPAPTSPAH